MLMCHCLNTPISLLHFSFTLLEHDNISKYYEKLHTQKKIALILLKNTKNSCLHQPSTTLPPSCGRTSCDRVSYIPELTGLDLLVQTIEELTYLERSAPGYQLCYCQPSAEHLSYASKWRIHPEMVPIPYITTDISSQTSFICMCC